MTPSIESTKPKTGLVIEVGMISRQVLNSHRTYSKVVMAAVSTGFDAATILDAGVLSGSMCETMSEVWH